MEDIITEKYKLYAIYSIIALMLTISAFIGVYLSINLDSNKSNQINDLKTQVVNLSNMYDTYKTEKENIQNNYTTVYSNYQNLQSQYNNQIENLMPQSSDVISLKEQVTQLEQKNLALSKDISTMELQLK